MTQVDLDDSQRAAVEVDPDVRQLVIAGPGSGKTEVVSNLIQHLVEGAGVDEVDGILVISFSNAAVFAADARLRVNGVGPVAVQTMDSLASDIISDLWDDDPTGLGFDRRVELATRLLRQEGWDRIDDLKHLVVDELQDVVGIRANFLLALISALPADSGFTLLGDPAQGIYDWQLRAENRPLSKTTSLELLAQVQAIDHVQVKYLTGQYRARSRDARRVVELRESVLRWRSASPIEEFFADLVVIPSIGDVVESAVRWSGTTAFLTANNGQALLTAGAIADLGARVEIRRSAHQRVLAGWIARLLAESPTPGVTRDEIEARANGLLPEVDPAVLWRALRSVTGGRGREVDIAALARGLRRSRPLVPDLIEPIGTPLVVSTIHRAKGLEFDNVVYVDFPDKPWLVQDEDPYDEGEASRRLFVALSRARDVLIRADGPDDRRLRRLPSHADAPRHWYLGGRAEYMPFGFELRVDDLDWTEPPGEDWRATQSYIAESVELGDRLRMELDLERSTLRLPVWQMLHGDHVVGRTSEAFGQSLVARIRTIEKKHRGWPGLAGARVESIATISGPTQDASVGHYGLWLSPVCAGMLHIEWNGGSDV